MRFKWEEWRDHRGGALHTGYWHTAWPGLLAYGLLAYGLLAARLGDRDKTVAAGAVCTLQWGAASSVSTANLMQRSRKGESRANKEGKTTVSGKIRGNSSILDC